MITIVRNWQTCATAVLAVLTALPLFAQAPAGADPDESISLPPFFVEPTDRPMRWQIVKAPGFTLLTTNDSDYGRDFARQYFRQLALVRQLVPDRYLWEPFGNATHIVVGTKSKRQATDAAMKQVLERVKIGDQRSAQSRFLPNMRLAGQDSSVVFAFQDSQDPRDSWNGFLANHMLRSGNPSWRDRHDSPGFHFTAARIEELLRRRAPALPAWLIAGVSGLYQTCRFSRDDAEVLPLQWNSAEESKRLRNDPDHPRELLIMPAFFAAPPPSDPEARRQWALQATLFVRWALLADEQRHREALWKFVDRMELAPASERTFIACFGFDLAEARDRLSDYLPEALSVSTKLTVPKDLEIPPLKSGRATPEQAGLALGEWERLETAFVRQHVPELTELYLNRARAVLHRARQENDTPALRGLAGILEFEAGNASEAQGLLETALVGGERRPRVLQVLAKLRFDELRTRYPETTPIPGEEIGAVTVLLDAATQTVPAIPETYVQMAELWRNTDAPPDRQDIGQLAAGTRMFPQHASLVAQMIILQSERGQNQSALQILNFARARCRDDSTARFYTELRARIQSALFAPR